MAARKRAKHDGVMLVDDHAVVRSGLRSLLEANGMTVVAEAGGVAEAIGEAMRTEPAVVVMDVRLGDGSGVDATREIRARLPDTNVLMLTSYDDDDALIDSIVAGASGFLLKELRGADIVEAVRAVARGENLIDRSTIEAVAERHRKGKHLLGERLALLSPQEERVLEKVAQGKTNAQIAEELELGEKTVKNYVSNVLMKLDVNRRAEAAAYLARHTAPVG